MSRKRSERKPEVFGFECLADTHKYIQQRVRKKLIFNVDSFKLGTKRLHNFCQDGLKQ